MLCAISASPVVTLTLVQKSAGSRGSNDALASTRFPDKVSGPTAVNVSTVLYLVALYFMCVALINVLPACRVCENYPRQKP